MLIRRYGLTAYWIIFVLLTLHAGRNRGMVRSRETVPYPWEDVFETCALIGVETAVLYVFLRPPTFRRSWRRVLAALVLTAGLVAVEESNWTFDRAGYHYVNWTLAHLTLLGLLVCALWA